MARNQQPGAFESLRGIGTLLGIVVVLAVAVALAVSIPASLVMPLLIQALWGPAS